MKKIMLASLSLLLLGCVPSYQNRTEMPMPLQDNLDSVESEYLERAANSAASETGCSAQEAETTILTANNEKFMIQHPTDTEKASFVTEEKIVIIGVTLCDEEFKYEVSCGTNEEYAALVFEYPATQLEKSRSCQVVAEGESVQEIATSDNDDAEEE